MPKPMYRLNFVNEDGRLFSKEFATLNLARRYLRLIRPTVRNYMIRPIENEKGRNYAK